MFSVEDLLGGAEAGPLCRADALPVLRLPSHNNAPQPCATIAISDSDSDSDLVVLDNPEVSVVDDDCPDAGVVEAGPDAPHTVSEADKFKALYNTMRAKYASAKKQSRCLRHQRAFTMTM